MEGKPFITHVGPGKPPWDIVDYVPQNSGPNTDPPIGIVWHTLEGTSEGARQWWRSCKCASAHFIVQKNGLIVKCVEPTWYAWHAGLDFDWQARAPFWRPSTGHNANQHCIGIEMEATAALGDFTEAQLQAAERLARWVTAQWHVVPEHRPNDLAGHRLHSEISALRTDPGPFFPLDRMLSACQGL